jgi:hypothetical protein
MAPGTRRPPPKPVRLRVWWCLTCSSPVRSSSTSTPTVSASGNMSSSGAEHRLEELIGVHASWPPRRGSRSARSACARAGAGCAARSTRSARRSSAARSGLPDSSRLLHHRAVRRRRWSAAHRPPGVCSTCSSGLSTRMRFDAIAISSPWRIELGADDARAVDPGAVVGPEILDLPAPGGGAEPGVLPRHPHIGDKDLAVGAPTDDVLPLRQCVTAPSVGSGNENQRRHGTASRYTTTHARANALRGSDRDRSGGDPRPSPASGRSATRSRLLAVKASSIAGESPVPRVALTASCAPGVRSVGERTWQLHRWCLRSPQRRHPCARTTPPPMARWCSRPPADERAVAGRL